MIVLSLTEEDRALLLPLTPEQRDQVFLRRGGSNGTDSRLDRL